MVEFYCLGYEHIKCKTCKHEHTWQELNQIPDTLRLSMQKNMTRINIDKCRITKMGSYQARSNT